MRVGIITWHYFDNVGSNLQAYALQQIVSGLGHDVQIINYRPKHLDENIIKKMIKNICVGIDQLMPGQLGEDWRFGSLRFRKERMSCTKLVRTREELEKLAKSFEAIICGSDQIWAPNCFNDVYMLSFVDDYTRKIAYAPSIGLNDIPENIRGVYKKWIGRLDSISVRETKGVQLLEQCCGINAVQVVDPTLLIRSTQWRKISEQETAPCGEYIFSYLLGDKLWIRERIKDFATKTGKKLVLLSSHPEDAKYADIFYGKMGSPKFLKCLSEAAYVLTDSFHGLLFSIQFHKDVYVFERYDSNEEQCQNSRIESILQLLGMNERKVGRETEMFFKPLDYEAIDERLKKVREESMDFLKSALE